MKRFIIPTLCNLRAFNLKEQESYIPNSSVTPKIRKNSGYFLNQTWDMNLLSQIQNMNFLNQTWDMIQNITQDMKNTIIRHIRNLVFCSNFLSSFKLKKMFSTGKVGYGGKNGI